VEDKLQETKCPDGYLLLHIDRESVSRAEDMFSHALIDQHIQEGFLRISDMEYDLCGTTVPELKKLLSSRKLKVSGKKADLVTRIIENFSVDEIRACVPDSYYLLTPAGQKAVENWREAAQKEEEERKKARIEKIKTFASLIVAQDYKAAISLMHPANVSSSTDCYFEAIHLCLNDLGIFNAQNAMVAVDSVVLGSTSRTIMEDMAFLDYPVNETDILRMTIGSFSYAQILNMRRIGCAKYQIKSLNPNPCDHCRPLKDKIFLASEAKIGATLPPFCDSCHCRIYMLSDDN